MIDLDLSQEQRVRALKEKYIQMMTKPTDAFYLEQAVNEAYSAGWKAKEDELKQEKKEDVQKG